MTWDYGRQEQDLERKATKALCGGTPAAFSSRHHIIPGNMMCDDSRLYALMKRQPLHHPISRCAMTTEPAQDRAQNFVYQERTDETPLLYPYRRSRRAMNRRRKDPFCKYLIFGGNEKDS